MKQIWKKALQEAVDFYFPLEDGYISSLKQAASDNGIEYGDDMAAFIRWAESELGIEV